MKINCFSPTLLDSLLAEAAKSSRSRQHMNIHQSYEEPCQRLFNAISEHSYIRPHRHSLHCHAECLIAIHGLFALVTFDSHGAVDEIFRFGTEKYGKANGINVGVEIPHAIWHTVIALVPDSILFEVKAGPFDPNLAKELAPWAPEEGGADSYAYLLNLRSLATLSMQHTE